MENLFVQFYSEYAALNTLNFNTSRWLTEGQSQWR